MDLSTMTFGEILFHGHWHIVGVLLFLVFLGVFMQEAWKELRAVHAHQRPPVRSIAFGPLVHDHRLGQTMTDGGEPVEEADEPKHD